MNDGPIELMKKMADQVAEHRYECRNCAWFAVLRDRDIGECHRNPPAVSKLPVLGDSFPTVSAWNLCGEFVHKKTGVGFRDHQTAWMKAIGQHIDWLERKVAGL